MGSGQTTVYPDNSRSTRASRVAAAGWDARIVRLVERDFAFLPLAYAGAGCLWRGIDAGLGAAVASGALALNAGSHALAVLERDLDVMLVSQDFSDALAVSRLWDGADDAAIIAFPAARFAHEHACGRAAVLGFADPGVVFRYPFLLAPQPLAAAAAIIVHPRAAAALEPAVPPGVRVLTPTVEAAADRADFERACEQLHARAGLAPTQPVPNAVMPRVAADGD